MQAFCPPCLHFYMSYIEVFFSCDKQDIQRTQTTEFYVVNSTLSCMNIELINKLGVLVTSPNLKSACILSLAKMHCRGSLAIQST